MARSFLIALTALLPFVFQPANAAENFSSAARSYSAGLYGSAVRHWLDLAERGHGPAQYNVGRMIYYGQGMRKDPIEALKWFLLASDNGIEQGRIAVRTVSDRMPRHQYIEASRRARALAARLSR